MDKSKQTESATRAADGAWYRQPVVWLGAAILVAALAGCIWTVVVAMRHPPQPIERPQQTLLGMPLDTPASARSSHTP